MFGEGIKTLKNITPYFLLIVFTTFSVLADNNDQFSLLEQPDNWWALLIPFMAIGGFFMSTLWVVILQWLKNDVLDNIYPIIPCAMLVYALLITFRFLADNPNALNTALLIQPDFIYTCTWYMATLVAFEVAKTNDTLAKKIRLNN